MGLEITLIPSIYARIAPHSGLAMKKFIDMGARVVNNDYQGEVGVILFNHSAKDFPIKVGDHVSQLVLEHIKSPIVQKLKILSDTKQGIGRFGSTSV